MSQKPKLTVFLDVVSPFAYMAFHVTQRSAIFKNCEVTYIPIFLGGVMKACDNRPPITIKNKDVWIDLERKRWAEDFKIPMVDNTPEGFPPNTLHVMRTLATIQTSHPSEKLIETFTAYYKTFWVQGQAIQKPEVFKSVLASVFGQKEADEIIEQSQTAEGKQKLQRNTEYALEEKCFGLPWFVAEDGEGKKERYWGFDHLGQVVAHLGLERGQGELRAML